MLLSEHHRGARSHLWAVQHKPAQAAALLPGTEDHGGWWRAPQPLTWHLFTTSCCNERLGAVPRLFRRVCKHLGWKLWASKVWVLWCTGERSHPRGTGMRGEKCGIVTYCGLVVTVGWCWGWSSHGCLQHMAISVSFLTSERWISWGIHSGCAHASVGQRRGFVEKANAQCRAFVLCML